MNRKPVDMAAPLIPPPEDGAHTLTGHLSDEKEATRLLDEQPQPLGRVRDRWSNTGEPPQREYRVTVLGLALTDAEVAHGGGVIPQRDWRIPARGLRGKLASRRDRGVESCRREAPAHPGRERRAFSSESVATARRMAHEQDAPKSPPRRWLELFAISRVESPIPGIVKYGCL